MEKNNPLAAYLAAELESERCKIIPAIAALASQPGLQDGGLWNLLALLPSRLERVQVVTSLEISPQPDASWTICNYLLNDPEQDVVGNAINAMTRSKVRSFAHRAFHYLKSPERPQRILYCLARYCEEAHDGRIAQQLAPTLATDLSDAYLARSLNALYRHGIKNESALSVAHELVSSHIDATNMDRKAAVAAITYLFFAGSQKHILDLRNIQAKVTIPELRRLLNWGFKEISLLSAGTETDKSNLSAELFWKQNFTPLEPNFTGYGCFEEKQLLESLRNLEKAGHLPDLEVLTERILRLGNKECIEWLASHRKFGIATIKKTIQSDTIKKLWSELCPTGISTFTASLTNTQDLTFWLQESLELLAIHLTEKDLGNLEKALEEWFKSNLTAEPTLTLKVCLGVLLAIENLITNQDVPEKNTASLVNKIILALTQLCNQKTNPTSSSTALAALMGCEIKNQKMSEFLKKQLSEISWIDIAYVHLRPSDAAFAQNILQRFEDTAKNDNSKTKDDKGLIHLTRTTALALLSSRSGVDPSTQHAIERFSQMCLFLDPNRNVEALAGDGSDESAEGDDSDSGAADWSGHTVVDRPIARWGAIIRALQSSPGTKELQKTESPEICEAETQLREAMRTAAHVEKRWIARALAQLGTDEAIKTLLYQGLQHIDGDFVSHVIRELLPSPHPRAQQALIRCVGRNAISDELKLNILDEIEIHNPEEILQELKTLEILRLPQHIDDAVRDAVGRVAALIDQKDSADVSTLDKKVVRMDGQDVDSTIRSLLPNCDMLNVDARSALRTAEMILLQSRGWSQGGMDLSPIVNMHCKAVELVLRDTFEPYTDALLRKGQLSRKLDILGYARPIPEKMQIFEDYLATLPVVKTIPYFSKFKLRKMLRGVCLYRPGKRFTLDGPKAFALFFLATSRLKCSFGLEKMLPLGLETDIELFEYIKLIHSLQDSRNRAVHEGLTWEAKDEIETMRAQAFKVIEISLKLKKHLAHLELSRSQSNATGIELGA
jgi:hypothetical protein